MQWAVLLPAAFPLRGAFEITLFGVRQVMILHHFQHQYQFRSSRLRRTLQAANSLRKWLKQRKVKAVVPSTASRRTPYPLDSRAHKRRNLIERMFCKLKNWRRIATRYDRYAQNYLSGLALAAIMIAWI